MTQDSYSVYEALAERAGEALVGVTKLADADEVRRRVTAGRAGYRFRIVAAGLSGLQARVFADHHGRRTLSGFRIQRADV